MTVDRLPGDDPREWLNRARSNLTQSRQEHPSIYLEDLCFQAQQAAEKALKALLLFHGESFPTPTTLLISCLSSNEMLR